MDPLSVTASLIAVCGAVASAVRSSKAFYKAPAELDALLNDLTDTEVLVREVEAAVDETRRNGDTQRLQTLTASIARCKELKLDIEKLISYGVTKPGTLEVNRLAWIRKSKSVARVRKRLRVVREELKEGLGSAALANIHLEIKDVVRLASRTADRHDLLASELSSLRGLFEETNTATKSEGGLPQITSQGESSQALVSTQTRVNNINDSAIADIYKHAETSRGAAEDDTWLIRGGYDSIVLRAAYRVRKSCKEACLCPCHSKRVFYSPSALSAIIGDVFMGYVGLPKFITPCAMTLCSRSDNSSIYFTYRFPAWWLSHSMYSRYIRKSVLFGINIGPARYHQYVDRTFGWVFGLAERGECKALQKLFDEGWASPLLVQKKTSLSLLRVVTSNACSSRELKTILFLLHRGADPYLSDATGRSATDDLLNLILILGYNPFGQLLDLEPLIEVRRFSPLHEAVLGLSKETLGKAIQNLRFSNVSINDTDSQGFTALALAAMCGRWSAVKSLLSYGANVNSIDNVGATPLHWAMYSSSARCTELLMNAGADANIASKWSATALTIALVLNNEASFSNIALLLPHAEVQYVDSWGNSLAHLAVRQNVSPSILKILLEQGCPIDKVNHEGFSVLLCAISYNNFGALEVLFRHNPDYKAKNRDKNGVLHYAAQYANADTLKLLRSKHFQGLNIHEANLAGRTVLDIAYNRFVDDSISDEIKDNLESFLVDIEESSNNSCGMSIIIAIIRKDHARVSKLLSEPTSYNFNGYHERTFLHWLVAYGDLIAFQMVRDAAPPKINIRAKHPCGRTAKEVLGARGSLASLDMVQTFNELCVSIEESTQRQALASPSSVPLQWAVVYNDHERLKKSLSKETILEIRSSTSQSILHFAASFADETSMKILTFADWPEDEFLIKGSKNKVNRHVQELDSQGFTQEDRFRARTPIPSATLLQSFNCMQATINAKQRLIRLERPGLPGLEWAILYNDHENIRHRLAQISGDHPLVPHKDSLMLHRIALSADLETIQLFLALPGINIDTGIRDNDGYTAQEIFMARKPRASTDIANAFEHLLQLWGKLENSVERGDSVQQKYSTTLPRIAREVRLAVWPVIWLLLVVGFAYQAWAYLLKAHFMFG